MSDNQEYKTNESYQNLHIQLNKVLDRCKRVSDGYQIKHDELTAVMDGFKLCVEWIKSNFDKTKLDKYKKFLLKEDENNKLELEYNKSIEHIEELTKKDNLEEHLNTFNSLSILEEEFQIIKLLSKYTLFCKVYFFKIIIKIYFTE